MTDSRAKARADIAAAQETTNTNQARAASPDASAWVSANAGTGKTYVLTRRVLRLLLSGTAPDQILCLTYTKAAAAEMSRRVFDNLAEWAMEHPDTLREILTELEGTAPDAARLALAPTLFARAIETPGGLKVQTIHAFCERLLQRFPLEAGVAPDFTILDADEQKDLLAKSIDLVLADAAGTPGSALHRAMIQSVTFAADGSFDQLLGAILGKRETLLEMLQAGEGHQDPIDGIAERLKSGMALPAGATAASIDTARAGVIDVAFARHAANILAEGTKTDGDRADELNAYAQSRSQDERIGHLTSLFLTASGTPRKSLMTKKPAEAHPDAAARLAEAQQTFADLADQAGALRVVEATTSVIRLADAIFQRYTEAKRRRAALDYDDLIIKTVALLGTERDAQWVLYKLDNGLDHILVDEAQDTSPIQWRIVSRLAEEFFSGEGVSEKTRTLFAVGDEKQSIYGFQGARPEMFAEMGKRFRERARAIDHEFFRVPLTMSFRSVAPVLEAVDMTFAAQEAHRGVTAGDAEIVHVAHRAGDPGLVEIWPTEKPDTPPEISAWRPLDEHSASLPVERVAVRVAAKIRGWIDAGDRLASTGKPITPGDILILVRRRQPVAPAMIRALKAAGIAVAGADRIRVTEQIAVMDMMSLGDFVLLPGDDLALATILKSPLFGLDDDDLLTLAYDRKGSLWQSLLARNQANGRYQAACETLRRWRARADYAPPFEFFSSILDRDNLRAAMLSRLGPEAGDALDEFLNQAIKYDELHPPSLQGFLAWLRNGGPEIRRDMEQGRDEVRIMTVHGAKGLEAPIVFLPDTCGALAGGSGPSVVPLATKSDRLFETEPFIWCIKGTSDVSAVRAAKNAMKQLDDEEYRRLLYVAMTRARDRLYIAGYEGKRSLPETCWYNLTSNALKPGMTEVTETDGRVIWRTEKTIDPADIPPLPGVDDDTPVPAKPDWMSRPARPETIRTIPVMPSRIMPLEEERIVGDEDQPDAQPDELASDTPASPLQAADDKRFQRGVLTHALLQHLPALAPENRRPAAKKFIEARGRDLPERLKRSVVDETMAILESEAHAPLFSDQSQAEVAIAAEIANPSPGGHPLYITGTIDRLIVEHDCVHFIDYKTNRPPPRTADGVIPAYIAQLAAYRLVLRQLYPGRTLHAALLWTDGARIMTIPEEQLEAVEPLLWSPGHSLEAGTGPSYVRIN